MDLLPDRPEILHHHRDIGGVLDIVQFHTDDFALPSLLAAIAMAIPQPLQRPTGVDIDRLQTLGARPIAEPAFLGDWCDPSSRALIRRGTVTLDDGTTLTDPPLTSLGARKIVSGSAPVPQPGSGGQFAYAFSHPPYPLDASPATIQALFEATIEMLLPPWSPTQILDWSHPELPSVSSYFADGMEWWGVFLFTLASPGIERLTVICASATD